MSFHNFMLEHYYQAETVDYDEVLGEWLAMGERIRAMVADTTALIAGLRARNASMLFEGAQGALLDVDHGTYPFVTSSNTTAGGASTGTGVGPLSFDYVLGIVKAYTTRVGAGPFPTELFDDMGRHLADVGAEFGSTTGRPRRCGWFDAVALRRAITANSISGLCVTKLDVLDGLSEIKICTGYRLDGQLMDTPPIRVDRLGECEPVYEILPGWQQSTVGITDVDDLPGEARDYIERLRDICGVPVDIVSTGPERDQTIVYRDPFD